MQYFFRLLAILFLGSFRLAPLRAQPESESPYSDQAFDPPEDPAWYDTPFFYVGLILFLAVLLLLLYRQDRNIRRRRLDR
jgi:hypothetical protein